VNLYAYVGNNSVMFIDLNWLEKTLIIWFTWYPGPSSEFDNNLSGIYNILQTFNNNPSVDTKFIRSSMRWSDKLSAAKKIKNTEYDKLIILGHSLWADSAVELSNTLQDFDIDVNLLITLDLFWGYACFSSETEVSSNVQKTLNFYQENDVTSDTVPWLYNKPLNQFINYENDVLIPNHFSKTLVWENFQTQDVQNILRNDTTHTSIDNDLKDEIILILNKQLWIK
jgi:hypothetical protein